MNAIAAEWLKLRTIRSSHYLLGVTVLAFAVAVGVTRLMIADYDSASPARQAAFAGADVSIILMPFAQFLVAVFAALAITGEYGSGAIGSGILAVPRRGKLMAAKVVVVGLCAAVAGQVLAFGSMWASLLLVGDRPAPIAAWESASEAVWPTVSQGLVVTMVALVAIGLGTVLRSTAGTLVSITMLLFVIPSLVYFLPEPWDERIWAIMPSNLAGQLSGLGADVLSSAGAAAVIVGYVVVFVGAGWAVFSRRDA